jgi:hypothetical protein
MHGALTHPDFATLVDPLSGRPERGKKKKILLTMKFREGYGHPCVKGRPTGPLWRRGLASVLLFPYSKYIIE